MRKKLEFVVANEELMGTKFTQSQMDNSERLNERINYFPFTHGEAIESQRKEIHDIQKQDLREAFKRRREEEVEVQSLKKEQILINKLRQEERIKKQMEEQKLYESEVREKAKEVNLLLKSSIDGPRIHDDNIDDKQRVSEALLPHFPAFVYNKRMRNDRRFGANPDYMSITMKQALERHEEQVKQDANEKNKLLKYLEDSMKYEKLLEQKQAAEKKESFAKHKQELDDMTEARREFEIALLKEKQEPTKTSIGPEETLELVEFKREVNRLKKEKAKEDLQA